MNVDFTDFKVQTPQTSGFLGGIERISSAPLDTDSQACLRSLDLIPNINKSSIPVKHNL